MCGIIAYVGNVDRKLIGRIAEESSVRGLHSFASYYKPRIGMAHCRYSTSGIDHQPLVLQNTLLKCDAFCFNGVISMRTKKEMERAWNIKMDTDNDGEIILRLTRNTDEILDFIKVIPCSFAGVFIFGDTLIAVRNTHRPLWYLEQKGTVVVASTRDIFKRAGIDPSKVKQLEPLKIYKWKA